jgi:outer membrane biosynthesis protein TonB
MARCSVVALPDDPLREDDTSVGAESEDLLGHDPIGVDGPVRVDDVDLAEQTSVIGDDDWPTTELPRVAAPAEAEAEAQERTWKAILAPWALFAVVAVVVLAATSTWASWLQGPASDGQDTRPQVALVPTSAPAPPSPQAAEPTPEPSAEAEPVAEPTRTPRATPERSRAPRAVTKAPPPPPPPPAGTSGTATPPGVSPLSAEAPPSGESDEERPAPGDCAPDPRCAPGGQASLGPADDDSSDPSKASDEDQDEDEDG